LLNIGYILLEIIKDPNSLNRTYMYIKAYKDPNQSQLSRYYYIHMVFLDKSDSWR